MSLNVSSYQDIYNSKKSLADIIWKTRFNFPKEFNGWRPGMIHTFLSHTGGGKSTLAKTIILDAHDENPDNGNILIWLTEEYKNIWEGHFFKGLEPEKYPRLKIFSERDFFLDGINKKSDMLRYIIGKIRSENINLIIIDNITTSIFYGDLDEQREFAQIIATQFPRNIPKIVFAHTNSSYKPYGREMMDEMHIHGSKELPKISEVFYCLTIFNNKEDRFAFLRCTKNRFHETKTNFFFLDYCKEEKKYRMDAPRDFEGFKSAFKSRNTL